MAFGSMLGARFKKKKKSSYGKGNWELDGNGLGPLDFCLGILAKDPTEVPPMASGGKQSPGPVQQNHSRDFQSPRKDRSSDPTMHSGSAGSLVVLSMGSPHWAPGASPVCNGARERSFHPRTRVDTVSQVCHWSR